MWLLQKLVTDDPWQQFPQTLYDASQIGWKNMSDPFQIWWKENMYNAFQIDLEQYVPIPAQNEMPPSPYLLQERPENGFNCLLSNRKYNID